MRNSLCWAIWEQLQQIDAASFFKTAVLGYGFTQRPHRRRKAILIVELGGPTLEHLQVRLPIELHAYLQPGHC